MKTLFWKIAFALLVLLSGSEAHAGSFATGTGDTSWLYRKLYTLAPNEQISFTTSACGAGEDTVMYLVDGAPGLAGARTTRGYNDDFGGTLCSTISFTNGAVAKDYTLVISTYSRNSLASVTLSVNRSTVFPPPAGEVITVGGLRQAFYPNGETRSYQTVGLRPAVGGGYVDTVLYVFNTAIGGTSYFDDDSGPSVLSKVGPVSLGTGGTFALVEGTYGGTGGAKSQVFARDSGNDADADGVPGEIETTLGTNPNARDTDADGINDKDEIVATEPGSGTLGSGDGSLVFPWASGTNDANVGADPLVKDLFVEVDYMTVPGAGGHTHDLSGTGNWTAFAGDTDNIFFQDGGWTGKQIRAHVLRGQSMTETSISFRPQCVGAGLAQTNFYNLKNSATWFDPLKANTWHYMIIGHQQWSTTGPNGSCQLEGVSGRAEILGPDILVTLGTFALGVGTVNDQRGTFMHELGHNLGLIHNTNNSNTPTLNSCIHSSVMNYRYQTVSWGTGLLNLRGWGYSNGNCSAPQVGGCNNACDASKCVPAGFPSQSPKPGCVLGQAGCDCDLNEWGSMVNLDFGGDPSVYDGGCPFPGSTCLGVEGTGRDRARASRMEEARTYFLGDTRRRTPWHAEFAERRKQRLLSRGMVEGTDFEIEPSTGRAYAIE